MKLLNEEKKNFNTVLQSTPRDLKILIESHEVLSQVKRKNITVGQYSMTTVSWFLILSEHTKVVCAAHRRN